MTRQERVKIYGSFLYCPKKDVLCSIMDSDDGICTRTLCYREDPEYLAKEKEIEKRIRENAEAEWEAKQRKEKESKPAKPSREQELQEAIWRKTARARKLYKQNKPKYADILMHEVMIMQGELNKLKERKSC